MDLLEQTIELMKSVEVDLLTGVHCFSPTIEAATKALSHALQDAKLDRAQELDVTQKLYDHVQERYFSKNDPVVIPEHCKLHVVFDLDEVLIKSKLATGEKPESSRELVTERVNGQTGVKIVHVDDDLLEYTTDLRRWARLVLTFLLPFCTEHVFTSASRGYMINVVSLIEGGYSTNATYYKAQQPTAAFNFFQPKRLSSTDFPSRHLSKHGKDIKELVAGTHPKAILLDDSATHHQAQPLHGILIKRFHTTDEKREADHELLRVLPQVLNALLESNLPYYQERLPEVISANQPEKYWSRIMGHVLTNWITTEEAFEAFSPRLAWQQMQVPLNAYAMKYDIVIDPRHKHNLPANRKWRLNLGEMWVHVMMLEQNRLAAKVLQLYEKEVMRQREESESASKVEE